MRATIGQLIQVRDELMADHRAVNRRLHQRERLITDLANDGAHELVELLQATRDALDDARERTGNAIGSFEATPVSVHL